MLYNWYLLCVGFMACQTVLGHLMLESVFFSNNNIVKKNICNRNWLNNSKIQISDQYLVQRQEEFFVQQMKPLTEGWGIKVLKNYLENFKMNIFTINTFFLLDHSFGAVSHFAFWRLKIISGLPFFDPDTWAAARWSL